MKKKLRAKARAEPTQKRSLVWYTDADGFDDLTCSGDTSLAHNPEIATAVDTIARLIGSMTIHLMENTDTGDLRIKNELSRKMDINPNSRMTRSAFVQWIIKTLMLEGNGNAVVYPKTVSGFLRDLDPIPPAFVSFVPDGVDDYQIVIAGETYDSADLLHFTLNPNSYYPWMGEGYRVALSDVANNL